MAAPERVAPGVSDAELATSEREAEVVSGRRGPDPPGNALLRYVSRYQRLPTAPIDSVAREGDVVAGFRVVLTLEHTSLLRDEDGLLFTGDARKA